MKMLLLFIGILVVQNVLSQDKPEGLFINSKAPEFAGISQTGEKISLKDLRKKGNVVLIFYRGHWCPYCNRYLKAFQDSLSLFTEKGATVVAISPELSAGISKTIEKTNATFPILHDEGLKIMKAYDVEFQLDEKTLGRYKNADIDIPVINGKNGDYLPVPAVYIINKEGSIVYRYFEPNYRRRVSIKEVLSELK